MLQARSCNIFEAELFAIGSPDRDGNDVRRHARLYSRSDDYISTRRVGEGRYISKKFSCITVLVSIGLALVFDVARLDCLSLDQVLKLRFLDLIEGKMKKGHMRFSSCRC